MDVRVLYEDDGVIAVDKPAGVVVIPARNEDAKESLRQRLEASRGEALWVVHRIDRDTSGVVLFARTAEAHRTLSMAFEGRRVEKSYLALTRGALNPREGVITMALHTARKGKMRPALPGELDVLDAVTAYTVREVWATKAGEVALVELRPRTGRQHQLRVHLRAKETPLLVDEVYGRSKSVDGLALGLRDEGVTVSRLTLHAWKVEVPWRDGVLKVEAPMAADLGALIAALSAT